MEFEAAFCVVFVFWLSTSSWSTSSHWLWSYVTWTWPNSLSNRCFYLSWCTFWLL